MAKNKKIGQGINALIAPKSVIDVKQTDILMSRIVPNPNQPRRIFGEKSLKQLSQSCLLYTSPSPRDLSTSRMPSSA